MVYSKNIYYSNCFNIEYFVFCNRDNVEWDKEQEETAIKVVQENTSIKLPTDMQGIHRQLLLNLIRV
jgi:3-isopropylmalate dehydratase small subunit